MYNRRKTCKADYVTDELRQKIRSGFFSEGRLPRKLDLITYFHVSQKTIEAALRTLTAEGLIHGVKGTGTFINSSLPPTEINLTHRLVMVVMCFLEGDHYGRFHEALREELLQRSLYPVSYRMDGSLLRLSNVSNLMSAPIKGVLYHGLEYWRHPFLENWHNLKSVAMELFDGEGRPPGGAVLVDYEAGGYMIARHFLEAGRRKFLFLTPKIAVHPLPKTESFWKNHLTTQLRNGICRAIREGGTGIQPLQEYAIRTDEHDSVLHQIMETDFDCIISSSDHLAYWARIKAESLGKTCFSDYSLCGCYNTPWSSASDLPFSSLDLNSQEICHTAVQLLEAGGDDILKVSPRLILRGADSGESQNGVQ